jgi:hypothetical protein
MVIYRQPSHSPCPVKLLCRYLACRGNSSGPIFITPAGAAVSRNMFAKQLNDCLKFCNLNRSVYKSHIVSELVQHHFRQNMVCPMRRYAFWIVGNRMHFTSTFGAVTRMEETQRIQRSRKGHRAHLTKVLNKATTIMEK